MSLTRDGISLRRLLFPVTWKGRKDNREWDNVPHDDKTEIYCSTRIFRSPVLFLASFPKIKPVGKCVTVDEHVINAMRVGHEVSGTGTILN